MAAPIPEGAAQEGFVPSPALPPGPTPTAPAPTKTYLSAWLTELLKLVQAGIEENILLSFINTAGTFNLTSEQIIYLRDLGVSNVVITALIQHDWELATGVRQLSPATVPPLASAPPTALATNTPSAGPTPPLPPPSVPWAAALTTESPGPESAEAESVTTDELNGLESLEEASPDSAQQLAQTPVRAPYSVRLTAPIVVLRAAGRTPNTMLLESFP